MLLTQFTGDSATHSIPLTWGGAAFTPGTSWTLIWTAKARAEDPDTAALIQKATDAGLTVTGSTAAVTLVPADTASLSPASLYHDIQAQHLTTGEVRTVALGRLKLTRDITRSTTVTIPINTTEEYVARGPQGEPGDPATVTLDAVLTVLGVPSYASLTAANAALTIGQPYYDSTLLKIQITTA